MKNFIQEGNVVTLVAPYAVESGDGLLVGALFGVATGKAALGAEVEAKTEGLYKLQKASGAGTAVTQGAKAYWDDTNKKITKTVGTNVFVGYFTAPAVDGDTDVYVKLSV